MGNFSTDPFHELRRSREQGYVGLHVEQGVPLLDRDLNLLADLVSATTREILTRHLGSGIAERNESFAVAALPADNDLRVLAPPGGGACLVAGIEVTIDAPTTYCAQGDVPALTTAAGADREDVVYLDVWVEEVDAARDARLANDDDVAMQTSVRLRPAWRVRVAEGTSRTPIAHAGHAHCALAVLRRPAGESEIRDEMIVDLRRTGLHLADLVERIERIEGVLGLDAVRPRLVALDSAGSVASGDGGAATSTPHIGLVSSQGGQR
jgi:hypothetical protein